jgi:hypothetical protein
MGDVISFPVQQPKRRVRSRATIPAAYKDEVFLFMAACSAAMASSRGATDARTARLDVQELTSTALNGSTPRLRAAAVRAILIIAEAPATIKAARRAANNEIAWIEAQSAAAL